MNRRDFIKTGLIGGLGLALGSSYAQSRSERNFHVTLVHTNDTHAHLDPVSLTLGGEERQLGGAARRAAIIDSLRYQERNMLVLDAGDVFQGTLYFTQYQGLADRSLMHSMAYQAVALGNHEFNLGPAGLATFLEGARFNALSANLDVSREPLLQDKVSPYTILRVGVGNEPVGIIGLTTTDTEFISNPGPTLVFADPLESAQNAVFELLDRGVSKIIVLSHLGYRADLELASQLVGPQVIVGGHSHTLLGEFPFEELRPGGPYPSIVQNPEGQDVLVVQAWEWGKVVGVLRLEFDPLGRLLSYEGEPILVTDDLAEDALAAEIVSVYALPILALRQQVVAEALTELVGERSVVRTRESNLSNLIADGMLWKTANAGTQIALQNGGGVRATIPAGPITVDKVYEVLPFGNTLVVLDLSGAEIMAALENSVSAWEEGAGRFLSGVAGLKYTFDLAQEVGSRVVSVEVETADGWASLDMDESYRVVTNNFIATGGDAFSMLRDAEGTRFDTYFVDAEAFMDYLRYLGEVSSEEEGRIVVLNEPES